MPSDNFLPFQISPDASKTELILTAFFGAMFGFFFTFFTIGMINPSLMIRMVEGLFGPEFINPNYDFTLNYLKFHYHNHGELVKTNSAIMKKNIVIPKHIDLHQDIINRKFNHLPASIKLNRDLITKVVRALNPKIDIIDLTEDADHFKLSLSIKKTNMPLLLPFGQRFLTTHIVNQLVKIYCQTNEYHDRLKSAKEEKIAKERRAKRHVERNEEKLLHQSEEKIQTEIKNSLTNLEEKYKDAKSRCNAQYQFAKSIYEKTQSEKLKKFSQRVVSAYQQLEKKHLELNLLTNELENSRDTNKIRNEIQRELASIASLAQAVINYYKEFEIAYIKAPEPESASSTIALRR